MKGIFAKRTSMAGATKKIQAVSNFYVDSKLVSIYYVILGVFIKTSGDKKSLSAALFVS